MGRPRPARRNFSEGGTGPSEAGYNASAVSGEPVAQRRPPSGVRKSPRTAMTSSEQRHELPNPKRDDDTAGDEVDPSQGPVVQVASEGAGQHRERQPPE